MVKNPSALQETQVQSLGQENPLEEEMATHSSILVEKIPWTEETGGLQSIGLKRVTYTQTCSSEHFSYCLEYILSSFFFFFF